MTGSIWIAIRCIAMSGLAAQADTVRTIIAIVQIALPAIAYADNHCRTRGRSPGRLGSPCSEQGESHSVLGTSFSVVTNAC